MVRPPAVSGGAPRLTVSPRVVGVHRERGGGAAPELLAGVPRSHREVGFLPCWPPQACLPAISRLLRRTRGAGGAGGSRLVDARGVRRDGVRRRYRRRRTATTMRAARLTGCRGRRWRGASSPCGVAAPRRSPRVRGACGGYGPVPACAFGDACRQPGPTRRCGKESRAAPRCTAPAWECLWPARCGHRATAAPRPRRFRRRTRCCAHAVSAIASQRFRPAVSSTTKGWS